MQKEFEPILVRPSVLKRPNPSETELPMRSKFDPKIDGAKLCNDGYDRDKGSGDSPDIPAD